MRDDRVTVVENPDGTATVHIEVDNELRSHILRFTGKKRLTKKLVEEFALTVFQKRS